MSHETICPLVTLVCVLFFCDCHVRIQKKTHLAFMSHLSSLRDCHMSSARTVWMSQIPCKIKVICKMNTLELLCVILGFEEAYWPFFFNGFSAQVIGLGIQWDENNLWKFIPEIRQIKINFHTISGAWVWTWH